MLTQLLALHTAAGRRRENTRPLPRISTIPDRQLVRHIVGAISAVDGPTAGEYLLGACPSTPTTTSEAACGPLFSDQKPVQ